MVLAALLLVLSLVLVAAALVVVREVRSDGYGRRPGPESFPAWAAAGLPSSSYTASVDR